MGFMMFENALVLPFHLFFPLNYFQKASSIKKMASHSRNDPLPTICRGYVSFREGYTYTKKEWFSAVSLVMKI